MWKIKIRCVTVGPSRSSIVATESTMCNADGNNANRLSLFVDQQTGNVNFTRSNRAVRSVYRRSTVSPGLCCRVVGSHFKSRGKCLSLSFASEPDRARACSLPGKGNLRDEKAISFRITVKRTWKLIMSDPVLILGIRSRHFCVE